MMMSADELTQNEPSTIITVEQARTRILHSPGTDSAERSRGQEMRPWHAAEIRPEGTLSGSARWPVSSRIRLNVYERRSEIINTWDLSQHPERITSGSPLTAVYWPPHSHNCHPNWITLMMNSVLKALLIGSLINICVCVDHLWSFAPRPQRKNNNTQFIWFHLTDWSESTGCFSYFIIFFFSRLNNYSITGQNKWWCNYCFVFFLSSYLMDFRIKSWCL